MFPGEHDETAARAVYPQTDLFGDGAVIICWWWTDSRCTHTKLVAVHSRCFVAKIWQYVQSQLVLAFTVSSARSTKRWYLSYPGDDFGVFCHTGGGGPD